MIQASPSSRWSAAKAIAGIGYLAALYSQTFFILEKRRQPLEIGIRNKLLAAGVMKPGELGLALMVYTRSHGYRRALRTGAVRLGLDGEPAGIVTTEEAARSAEELQKRGAKLRERKAAQARSAEETARQVAEEAARAVEAAKPKRLNLSDQKAAAQARRETMEENANA